MNYDLSCRLEYVVEQPSTFLFNLSVDRNECEFVLQEHLRFEPQLAYEELHTRGGLLHRVRAPQGTLTVLYKVRGRHTPASQPSAGIDEVPSIELPAHVLEYVYPSRFCQSDLCIDMANELFGSLARGYGRVLAICRWIHRQLRYESGSSGSNTSALQTLDAGSGVCRDYAHLGISFCRALNIPARFVAAYAPGLQPPDFHACFEAYLGHRWWLFDPTFMVPRRGIIRVGTGRDAADVSFATILGWVQLGDMSIQMDTTDPGPDGGVDEQAITIAGNASSHSPQVPPGR